MLLNIVGGTLICAGLAVMSPNTMVATVFMREQLGASRTLVGLNLALWILGVSLCLPGGWLFNSLKARRPTWLVLMLVGRSFLFVVAFAAIVSDRAEWRHELAILVLCANVACVTLSSLTAPGWWAWMADLIPESIRGYFFGRRYQVLLLSTALSMVIAGLILDRVPASKSTLFFGIFLVASILSIIDPILFRWVPEPARPSRSHTTFREALSLYARPLKDKAFMMLTFSAALWTLAYNMPLTFCVLYQRGETINGQYVGCGASLQFLAIMQVLQQVAIAVVATQWGHLADRIGHRTVYILASLYAFASLPYFVMGPQNYYWLLPLHLVVSSVIFAGAPVAQQNLMIAIAPQAEREYYVSTFWCVVCGAGAIGPWFGGILADALPVVPIRLPHGQPMSYLHIQLILCYGVTLLNVLLMRRIPEVQAGEVLPWFARMMSGSLFRTAWNISAIGGAMSPYRRVRALQAIRPSDGNVVLRDVSGALEDPDSTVRREALHALGRIGTPEAIELLMWYIHEPDRPTRAAAAEALGMTHSTDGTIPLIAALRDDDVNVRQAAAEALTNIMDPRTADTLLELLETEQDAEVLVSVATALSRLCEFRGLRRMLDLTLQSPSRIVRAHIIVAIGDMLGPSGQFYRLWRQDRRVPGSASLSLARRIRKIVRSLPRSSNSRDVLSEAKTREIRSAIQNDLDTFVEEIQGENYPRAISALCGIASKLFVLQCGEHLGVDGTMGPPPSANAAMANSQALVSHLDLISRQAGAAEAYWDGLTLLAAWSIVQAWARDKR